MGKQFVILTVVMFMILASLTLTLIGIMTDNWSTVEPDGTKNQTFRNQWTYTYGIWKKCYDVVPENIPMKDRVGGRCVYIYEKLIIRDEPSLPEEQQTYQHLLRSHLAFAIVCAAAQFGTIISLICGVWPGNCASIKRPKLYITTALMLLFACICGFISGICFIALRNMDTGNGNIYPSGVMVSYGWSFIVHWIGSILCLIESTILLVLLKEAYEDVADKFNYFNIY